MKHLDLFSGIGGFAIAVDEVFGKSEHIFCEIDEYCRALLKKRFEGSVIYGDIRQLRFNTDSNSNGCTIKHEEINTDKAREQALDDTKECCRNRVDILTGGFPCQPFSQAGKRRGTEDNRFLWPQMLRVIREFKPTWVIAENVRGLLTIEQGVVFEQVCLDLEGEGYETQPFIIPAVAKNAPHRRDRVWFVANSKRNGSGGQRGIQRRGEDEGTSKETSAAPITDISNAPDTESGSDRRYQQEVVKEGQSPCSSASWQRNWLEVATELCGVDDGLPAGLDGFELSKAGHRVQRLKALGNAIVPQVAEQIFLTIAEIEQK